MKTLRQTKFNNYLKDLEYTTYGNNRGLCDEYGDVITYNVVKGETEFNLVIIDREEFELTEEQKQQLASVLNDYMHDEETASIVVSSNHYEEYGLNPLMFI